MRNDTSVEPTGRHAIDGLPRPKQAEGRFGLGRSPPYRNAFISAGVVAARMDDEVIIQRRGQVRFEPRPICARISRDEQRMFGSEKEEVGVARVLGDHVHRSGSKVAHQGFPIHAEVGRTIDVRGEVTVAVSVKGYICIRRCDKIT